MFSLSSAAAASAARAGLVCRVDMPLGSLLSIELLLVPGGGGEGALEVNALCERESKCRNQKSLY